MSPTTELLVPLVIVFVITWTVIGKRLGADRGRPIAGALLGLFFGPVGAIVIGLALPTPRAVALRELAIAEARYAVEKESAEGDDLHPDHRSKTPMRWR